MANERLRVALLESDQTPDMVAEALKVDRKTVERWVGGRTPYTRFRHQLAKLLDADETYLWPGAVSSAQLAAVSESEIIAVHPHRWAVPREAWSHLFDGAEEEIGILVYSGMFLADDAGLLAMLRDKANQGVRIRILIGDPDAAELNARGEDEGIGESLAAKVRNVRVLLSPLAALAGIEIRQHATTLYNSIFRADAQLLVNMHIYGVGASQAPVMHLRRITGGSMVTTYLDSFDRVWDSAQPLPTGT
jgi:plasmid maintenance system antidote protein VapI